MADVLDGTLAPGLGDSLSQLEENFRPFIGDEATLNSVGALEKLNPTLGDDGWDEQPQYTGVIKNLTFVRFGADGRVRFSGQTATGTGKEGDVSGWILQSRIAVLDSKIGANAGSVNVATPNTPQAWTIIAGSWATQLSNAGTPHTRIRATGNVGQTTHSARTTGKIPANRGFRANVSFLAVGNSAKTGHFLLSWAGGAYTIHFYHGLPPVLYRTIQKTVGNTTTKVEQKVAVLHGAPPIDFSGGYYSVTVQRIAGRLVIGINDQWFHFLKLKDGSFATPGSATGTAETGTQERYGGPSRARSLKAVDLGWEAGAIQVRCYGVRVSLGLSMVKYSKANGTLFEESFTRHFGKSAPVPGQTGDSSGSTPLPWKPVISGWHLAGTSVKVVYSRDSGVVGYKCTLKANADGIDTPFVSTVSCSSDSAWQSGSSEYLDVRKAATALRLCMAQPPHSPGADGVLELDRALLSALRPEWEEYVGKYNPVEILARWQNADGEPVGDYVKLFSGYAIGFHKGTEGINAWPMSVVLKDESVRLHAPASIVDHRFAPLDVYWAQKILSKGTLAANGGKSNNFYGWDGVYNILRICSGVAEANRLATAFSESHYPLLSANDDTIGIVMAQMAFGEGRTPTSNQFLLTPPYGSDGRSFIGHMEEYDHACFYYGWRPDDDRSALFQRPIYGQIVQLLKNRPVWVMPDGVYEAGDENRVLSETSLETRPERDINRFMAVSTPPGTADLPFVPGLRMAVSRFDGGPESADLSWERTHFMKNALAWVSGGGGLGEGGVEYLVQALKSYLEGVNMVWPSYSFAGDARLSWGDYVRFKFEKNKPTGYTPSGAQSTITDDVSTPDGSAEGGGPTTGNEGAGEVVTDARGDKNALGKATSVEGESKADGSDGVQKEGGFNDTEAQFSSLRGAADEDEEGDGEEDEETGGEETPEEEPPTGGSSEPEEGARSLLFPDQAERSDFSLGLDGQTFRAERIIHSFQFSKTGKEGWKTAVQCRPLGKIDNVDVDSAQIVEEPGQTGIGMLPEPAWSSEEWDSSVYDVIEEENGGSSS